MSTRATRDLWLEAHPYLRPMARLQLALGQALDALPGEAVVEACREVASPDGEAGTPALFSSRTSLDLDAAGALLLELVERLDAGGLTNQLERDVHAIGELLRSHPAEPRHAMARVVEGTDSAQEVPCAGMLRVLGWTLLGRILAPTIEAIEGSPSRDQWQRSYCPTCGAPPLLAQLVPDVEGSRRSLGCGLCGTRWAFARIGCPFCGNTDSAHLGALEIEDEPRLRLDTCDACQGYLKTYVGEGEEALFLSDWASVHLDLLAKEKGLRRAGASLFAL